MKNRDQTYRFGDCTLDTGTRQLHRGEQAIELQPKAFDVLRYFVENPDRVIAKTELLDHVWAGTVVTENVLSRIVSMLRKVLVDDARSPRYIGLVPRVGYRFLEPVTVQAASEARVEQRRRIAVLPFRPIDAARSDPALELGMADTLTSRLSRLGDIVVRPLASVQQVATNDADPLSVARILDVDAVLVGSILMRDKQLRITATLLDSHSEDVLWAETFDDALPDVFAVQDSICGQIVDALAPRLRSRLTKQPQTSTQAYRAYLEGRLYLGRFAQADVERAVGLFERALDEDPSYAAAWVGLAECNEFFGTTGVDSAHHYELARRSSRRALKLDPDNPDALVLQGKVAWQYDWDWLRADTLLSDAVLRFPNHSDAAIAYSDFCSYMTRYEEGIAYARRAIDIDPVSPWANALLAQALHMGGRDRDAIEQATHTLELAPGFPFAHLFLGLAKATLDSPAAGLPDIKLAVASGRPDFPAAYGTVLALAGEEDAARQILAQVEAAGDAAPPFGRAMIHLGLGEHDKAAETVEECIRKRDWHVLVVHADPFLIGIAAGTPSAAAIQRLMDSTAANV